MNGEQERVHDQWLSTIDKGEMQLLASLQNLSDTSSASCASFVLTVSHALVAVEREFFLSLHGRCYLNQHRPLQSLILLTVTPSCVERRGGQCPR